MIQVMNRTKTIVLILFLFCALTGWTRDYPASLFGVRSEGITLNTMSIQKAIDFISENGGGKLVFYVGRYLTGTIRLKSNVTIELREGAVLVATPSIYDYYGVNGIKALVVADGQENIGIIGKGVMEGQGSAVLEQINDQRQKGYLKETTAMASPALIALNHCSKIIISGINLVNACGNVQEYSKCKNMSISGLTVKSTSVPGTKGMVISGCDSLKVSEIYFETSGKELDSDGTSKNVEVVNCKNSTGKKIVAKN